MSADNKFHFDEDTILPLVLKWQETKEECLLKEIFKKSDCMIRALVFSRGIYQYMEINEIISLIHIKIWRGLHLYTPLRGRLYSFLVRVIHNRITQAQLDTKKVVHHESLDSEEMENAAKYEDDDGAGMEELEHKIMKVKTICTDPKELEAQRWLVKSLISSSFEIRRHHAANAMTRVYGIHGGRSRQLHDYTLLEVRRALLQGIKIPKVYVRELDGTRQKHLKKYREFLTGANFNRLVFLMKNLSISIIEEFGVANVLYGFTNAVALFE
jgi:hypothetical protein